MTSEYKPFINIGPGEFIQEELDARDWKQKDLAGIIGYAEPFVNDLIKGKRPITIDTARLLSKVFGQSPHYWLNLQTNYQLRDRKETQKEREVSTRAEIYKYMPIREMKNKRWLQESETTADLVDDVKKFWSIRKSIRKLDFSFMEAWELPRMRKSKAYSQYNMYYAHTWYQMARKSSRKYSVPKYEEAELRQLAGDVYAYTSMPNGVEEFLSALSTVGVKFFVLAHLPKTYIDGASFYDRNNPVIVYTRRYNRNDNFWFTLAHEIAHILLDFDTPERFFIDNLEETATEAEREADDYAGSMIRAREILRQFKPFGKYIQRKAVLQCAEELRVHPGVVVGVLQEKGKCERKNLNTLKTQISDLIPCKYWVEKHLD